MHFTYPATIKDDGEGHFLVTFRDILFAATEGKTIDEALTEAQDCLETAIASCVKDKEDIPTPSKLKKGDYPIRLPAQTAAKTALYIAIKKSGLSNSELARRLGTDEKEIRRMIDPWHPTKLPRIEMALSALGFHLSVSMVGLDHKIGHYNYVIDPTGLIPGLCASACRQMFFSAVIFR